MDAAELEARTGWRVHHLAVAESTNDVALQLLRGGAPARTVVVADRQTRGRGREARAFASPAGGLYASLLVDARAEDRPARVVGLVAVAAAEAIEATSGLAAAIKWPNDLWVRGRKAGGILLEAVDAERPVVAGVGVNLRAVPADLPPEVRAGLAALDEEVGRPVVAAVLLEHLVAAVDRWQARGLRGLEEAWRQRLALVGEAVECRCAGRALRGVLEDADLRRGLLLREGAGLAAWRPAEHVQDLRPAARTIS